MQTGDRFPKLPQETITTGNYITSKSTSSRREEISENSELNAQIRQLAAAKSMDGDLVNWFRRRRELLQMQVRNSVQGRARADERSGTVKAASEGGF